MHTKYIFSNNAIVGFIKQDNLVFLICDKTAVTRRKYGLLEDWEIWIFVFSSDTAVKIQIKVETEKR